MSIPGVVRPRFNREYFGYIVGYPEGDIVLAAQSAGPLLEAGAPLAALEAHLLRELEVRPGFHLNTPPLVWLELTRRCNLRCPHCYIDGGLARDGEMSAAEFHALIDEFADMGVWAIALTGGEPTLHPDFVALVRHARARDLLVGIATNGMFLSEALLDALPRDGVIISVSYDDLHIGAGHKDADFKVASKAVLRSQAMGFETNIMTNTHRGNVGRLEGLMSWAEKNGVSVRSVPFSPLGRGKQFAKDLENTVDDVEKSARFWLRECEWEHEYHRRVGLCVGLIFNYGLSLAYMTGRCSSARFLAYVCSDGAVYPCTMCAAEEILSPGSVRGRGFADLWRSEWKIRQFSWDNFKNTCEGCVLNQPEYYCASRCPAMSHARHGTLFDCGASSFEIASTVVRSALLASSPLSATSGRPLVPDRSS
jgi:radical SAM protein with 4Fe4S-binding SPASM domain